MEQAADWGEGQCRASWAETAAAVHTADSGTTVGRVDVSGTSEARCCEACWP